MCKKGKTGKTLKKIRVEKKALKLLSFEPKAATIEIKNLNIGAIDMFCYF